MKLLMSKLERSIHVKLYLGEDNCQSFQSNHDFGLVIAADGPRSPREQG